MSVVTLVSFTVVVAVVILVVEVVVVVGDVADSEAAVVWLVVGLVGAVLVVCLWNFFRFKRRNWCICWVLRVRGVGLTLSVGVVGGGSGGQLILRLAEGLVVLVVVVVFSVVVGFTADNLGYVVVVGSGGVVAVFAGSKCDGIGN